MKDKLDELIIYQKAMKLWEECWDDTEALMTDIRGREITRQIIRSVGSISANIEEGFGRGFGKEYINYLRISRGSARESKGWYKKSSRLLEKEIVEQRTKDLSILTGMITNTITALQKKRTDKKEK
ncbi:MAG: four helix bundle protein [Bacteroidota bacterium]